MTNYRYSHKTNRPCIKLEIPAPREYLIAVANFEKATVSGVFPGTPLSKDSFDRFQGILFEGGFYNKKVYCGEKTLLKSFRKLATFEGDCFVLGFGNNYKFSGAIGPLHPKNSYLSNYFIDWEPEENKYWIANYEYVPTYWSLQNPEDEIYYWNRSASVVEWTVTAKDKVGEDLEGVYRVPYPYSFLTETYRSMSPINYHFLLKQVDCSWKGLRVRYDKSYTFSNLGTSIEIRAKLKTDWRFVVYHNFIGNETLNYYEGFEYPRPEIDTIEGDTHLVNVSARILRGSPNGFTTKNLPS
ncbi:MAG: hypothetical protein KatS3mg087_1360 [Patescibacteria group bacterium]|nr:MAG: hypothetical protein KatS3mg087_1360 [Patescibacteria group bacterium]